ncbi:hypothetical protein [Moritella viscosa]|uniref:hypothetical protein n=1 Tax=Moritella viscosa TaxID=80854 RepID=UPI000A777645|nr:hypothetical protein [Moritella viscosa]
MDNTKALKPLTMTAISIDESLIDGITMAIKVAAIANSNPKFSRFGMYCPATIPANVEAFQTT